jgi:DedD protein
MTESPDPQLQLKKRARRRLVGAVASPVWLRSSCQWSWTRSQSSGRRKCQIRIPGQDQPPFQPKLATREAPAAVPAETPTAVAEKAPAAAADPAHKEAVSPPARAAATAAQASAGEGKVTKPAEKAPEKADERKTAKAVEKPTEKSAEKKVPKPADKTPEKPPAKAAEKTGEKKADKPVADRSTDKAPPKKVDKPLEAATDDGGSKPAGEESATAGSQTGKSPATPPAKSSGQQVIVIGAFANPDNARQLQSKISAAGVSTYTEVLETPDGKKTRVRAGPFPNREAAEKALDKLKRSASVESSPAGNDSLRLSGPGRRASLLLGMWRGVVGEIIALVAWILAFFAASWWGAEAARLFIAIADPTLRLVAGWVSVVIGRPRRHGAAAAGNPRPAQGAGNDFERPPARCHLRRRQGSGDRPDPRCRRRHDLTAAGKMVERGVLLRPARNGRPGQQALVAVRRR